MNIQSAIRSTSNVPRLKYSLVKGVILNTWRVAREDLSEEVMFEQTPEGNGASYVGIWGRRVQGGRSRLCKGPEAGVHVVCLKNMEAGGKWGETRARRWQKGSRRALWLQQGLWLFFGMRQSWKRPAVFRWSFQDRGWVWALDQGAGGREEPPGGASKWSNPNFLAAKRILLPAEAHMLW